MTRYNSPLPQTAGRPTSSGPQQPVRTVPAGQQPMSPLRPSQAAFPGQSAFPGNQASHGASQGYAADAHAGHRDPYAALRPDGYGYAAPQPAQNPPASDPYGLAGYTAPQPPAPGYGGHPVASPSLASYGQSTYDSYPARGQTAAGQPYAPPAPSFGSQQPGGYGTSNAGYAAPPPAPHGFGSQGLGSQGLGSQGLGSQGLGAQGFGSHGVGAPHGESWGGQGQQQSLSVDPTDYGAGYGANGTHAGSGHWDGTDPYFAEHAEPPLAPAGYQAGQGTAAQQSAGFDQSYAEDEAQYDDEPRRGGWKKIVGLVASTVLIGGALTLAYTTIMGSGSGDPTPVVKSAAGPSKVKPSEPGGKQFAYTDSKVMGRLGENEASDAESEIGSGVKKVPVVVVGRDGSIQPPDAVQPERPRATLAAPGLAIVDGFDGFGSPGRDRGAPTQAVPTSARTAPAGVASVTGAIPAAPPAKKASAAAEEAAQSVTKDVTPAPPKKQKVAAVTPPPSAATSSSQPSGAGYVAVLASVPASGSSRIDALKQFADMQQKYTSILQNKTPDVQEANLGAKGTYHRLLVGPPGSREAASQVCTQLKAEGYSGCWVTAY